MKKILNQKLINLIEYYNLINANLYLSNSPINRTNETLVDISVGTKLEKLNKERVQEAIDVKRLRDLSQRN